MEYNVFFLKKEEAKEFQDRCVIAIFLEKHPDIKFKEYIGTNVFVGIIDNAITYIYLFDTPRKGSVPGVVFRSRNRTVAKSEHGYELFAEQFLDEYKEYRNNVYEYIMQHFFTDWNKYFGELFISAEPENDNAFKYKQHATEKDKEGKEKLGQFFADFLDGALVFSNPKTFNDPFDCDCELADLDSKICLLWNAFNSIKYGGCGSTSVKKKDIEKILNEMDIFTDETKNYKDGKKKDNVEEVVSRIIAEGKKDDKGDMSKTTGSDTIEAIVKAYKRMYCQVVNLKERFRVFCTTDKPNDILMWGYYCDGGKGVCCEYERKDIIGSILAKRRNCICVYGEVLYRDDKPKYEYTADDLADNIFEYVMRCIFTKYTGWKHENEFRYVLMEGKFDGDHISVHSQIQEYYLGCKMDDSQAKAHIYLKSIPVTQLDKAPDKYKLIRP